MNWPAVTNQTPGVDSGVESYENVVQWGSPLYFNFFAYQGLIHGSSRDDSHTGKTHILRAGLLMAYSTVKEAFVPYDSAAAVGDGDTLTTVLTETVDMLLYGANQDRFGRYLLSPGARIKVGTLFTNDVTGGGPAGPVVGHAAEAAIRTALQADPQNFVLDDWYLP